MEIARGDRPDFFNLRYKKPQPFVPRYLRAEIPGRIDFLGKEIQPLDLSNLNSILDNFKKYKVNFDILIKRISFLENEIRFYLNLIYN